MDWSATMIAAAGGRPTAEYPLDGEDMRDVLALKRKSFDREFYWRTYKQGAMRSGKWKYVREGKTENLYDLSVDEHEQADFGSAEPETLKRLRSAFQRWESGMQKYGPRNERE
jgi:arylsulfatase A-like enzyme